MASGGGPPTKSTSQRGRAAVSGAQSRRYARFRAGAKRREFVDGGEPQKRTSKACSRDRRRSTVPLAAEQRFLIRAARPQRPGANASPRPASDSCGAAKDAFYSAIALRLPSPIHAARPLHLMGQLVWTARHGAGRHDHRAARHNCRDFGTVIGPKFRFELNYLV